MSTSNPLNPHPQDAHAGDRASAGVGSLQKAAGVKSGAPGDAYLIDKGYVPVRHLTGKVVGVWGDAHVRHVDGSVAPLHVGDVVKKGEVVLTAQDGIVQIEAAHLPASTTATASDDVERIISQVNRGDADVVPAAGPNTGGANGSLEEGLRVGRDAEAVTPATLAFGPLPTQPTPAELAPTELPRTPPQANPDTELASPGTPVTFDPRTNDSSTTALTIVSVGGQHIDSHTPVTLPTGTVSLNTDGSLTYTPNPGSSGSTTFTYGEQNAAGGTSTSTVTIAIGGAAGHAPVATPDTFAAAENAPLSGNLAANDTPSTDGGNVWSLASGAAHGTVAVNADGTFSYVPATGYHGADSFTYTITDADGSTSTTTVTLNIAPAAPVAANDTAAGNENAPISGNLAGNDTPVAGETNTWAVTGQPSHGTVAVNPDGSYTYTPAAGYSGADHFTYSVTDGAGQSSTATVTLTVAPIAPTAAPDAVATQENTPVSGNLGANDAPVAGETNTWAVAGGPAHGSVAVHPDGTYTYTPAAGYVGGDSFSYSITDGAGQVSTATVTLQVGATSPTATPDNVAAHEDTPVTGSLAGNDFPVAGETNTWSLASSPSHGTVAVTAEGSYTYTPAAGYTGTDSFTYTITDASGHTSTAAVTLTVAPIAPTATPDAVVTQENVPVAGNLGANDTPVAGEATTWALASNPAHGTVAVSPDGTFTYTPAAGYSGGDSFTYTITDTSGQASTATVTLQVGATAPIATPDTATVAENATLAGTLAGNDFPVAGETNTWSLTTAAAHGAVTVDADGSYSYTPATGYTGADSFTYTIIDASGHTSTATVDVTVAPIAPTAVADTVAAHENTPVSGSLAGNDTPVAGESNTWAVAANPTHGSVAINPDGTFTYTPTAGPTGADSFTYTITDRSGLTSTATVTLSVAPIAPVAADDAVSVQENTPASGSLAGNDTPVAGETNTWAVTGAPSHGAVTVNPDGTFTYTPTTGYTGTDSFTYTITDHSGLTSTATVTLSVAPIAPVAADDAVSVQENTPASGSLAGNDTPVAGETNTWALASNPAHGSVAVNADGTFTYMPATGYSGADSFTYTITDHAGQASTATVSLLVGAGAPVATADNATASENTPLAGNLAANDFPVAGETNTWTLASNPAHGSVTVNPDGTFAYTPATGYTGADSFTYTITDATGHTSTATVSLNVAPIAPTAVDDAARTVENAPVSGTLAANDTPVAGEINTWAVTGAPSHGAVVVHPDGTYTYTPAAGYHGADSFTYTITDHSGLTSTATVTLEITPAAPVAVHDAFGVSENTTSGTLSVAANDAPVAGENNTWSVASTTTAHGTITPAADFATTGNFTYTPNAGFSGTDSFSYTITDSSGHASTATVTLTVAAVSPVAVADAFDATENATSGTLSVATNDTPVAGETSTWSVASTTTAHGTIAPAPDFATTGNFTYTPTAGYSGADSFSYTITDSSGHTSTATVSINVAPVNPVAVADTFNATENSTTGTLNLKTNDTPVAGEANTWSLASTTTLHGTITPASDFATTGNFTYTPTAGYIGSDSFSYTITDGSGHTSTATVTLNVAPINPTAVADAFAINENSSSGTLSVKTNDIPVAGETNTWSVASTTTAHGTITPAADFASTGNFTYTPTAGYNGTDSFTYTVTDGSGHTSTATVTLTVNPAIPVAANDSFAASESTTTGTLSVKTNDTPVANETNTWSVASTTTAHGTIAPASDFATTGNFTYTPTSGYIGSDSFSYTITDSTGHTSTATVTLNVAPINPTAVADAFAINENSSSGTLSVATNDTPVAGETNTWSVASTTTAHGTITPAADFASTGNFTYTPTPGYNGTDSFTYTVTDGSGHTSTATVTLTVNPAIPVAANDSFAASESTTTGTLSVKTNDTPVAGETSTWSVASTTTAHGTITPASDFATTGNFTYTPTAGYIGSDSFSYTITDSTGHTSTATVTLNVAPINPTAVADAFAINENSSSGTLSVKTNDIPVAGETNTWSVASTTTAHGTITPATDFASTGNFTYTPTAGYNGTDSFTYTVTDGSGHTSTATVTLTVNPAIPVAANDSFAASESTTTGTLSVKTNDTPVANETNTWSVASTTTAHGTIAPASDFATTGNFTYTPTAGYIGSDSFSYTITDSTGHTSTATVTLNVAPINPTAVADAFAINENSSSGTLSVKTNDIPVAGETNTWSVASTTTAHGTITPATDFASTGNFTYTPTPGYNGTDSFTYTVTDGSGHTSTATVTLTVNPAIPVAANDSFAASESTTTGTLSVKTNDTPVANETNTWSVASTTTAHGTITPASDFATTGNFTYTPTAGYIGSDSFSYTITDSTGHTSTATVTLNVAPINPTAVNDTFAATEDATTGTLNLRTNDTPVGGETNTWSVASTTTAHGSITPAADFATSGKFTYTPTLGFSGTDSFSYTITDTSGHTSTATVTLNVAPINPTAVNDTFAATEDATTGTLNLKTNDTPVGGETNTWSVASTTTAHGSITPASDFATSGKFTYTPTSGFSGTDSFSYTITDGSGHTSTATVTLNVAPINPVAVADAFTLYENSTTATLSVRTNDTPVAGETNTWSVASTTTAHGTITPASDFATTGNFTYTPTTGYIGADTFSYTLTDTSGHTSTATVSLTVKPVPLAANDTFTTNEDTAIVNGNLAANDTPAAGETNTWALDTTHNASHGTVTVNANGTFTYTPTANYGGTDSFNYIVTDADGQTSTATVTINVTPVADAPTLTLASHSYAIGTTFDEHSLGVSGYANLPVSGLAHGTETGGTTPDLAWHTDNGGNTLEIGLASTYAVTGDTTQIVELEQNLNDASNLYTNLATKAGELYTLSFDFAARTTDGAATNSVIHVYWEGQLVDTLNSQGGAMTHHTLDLMATTTGSSQLEFVAGDSNSYGGLLDNISFGLHQDTGVQGYIVNLPTIGAALTDTDGSESLKVTIDTIPVGATLTDGTHSFTATAASSVADVSGWSLSTLTLTPTAAFTGDVTLGVHATSTEASNGSTATTSSSVTLHVLADTSNVYGTTGADVMTTSATGNDIRWGLDGNDTLTGGSGQDTLVGGAGNDSLIAGSGATILDGGTGNDHLVGGAGADTLSGGAGNDTMTGGGGVDVFKWHLGDQGTAAAPAVDTITDFNPAAASSGGDVLDLRDLLVGEARPAGTSGAGDLTNYLHFSLDAQGDTVIHVSSHGNGQEDQQIVLTGVNLFSSSTSTDAQIITQLLGQGKLVTNGH